VVLQRDALTDLKPPMLCKTIGWLFKENKKCVVICHTKSPTMVTGLMHIPKISIKNLKNLSLVKSKGNMYTWVTHTWNTVKGGVSSMVVLTVI